MTGGPAGEDRPVGARIAQGAIERGTGAPLWRQIETRIRAEIEDGAWRPGDRLPSETALAQRFGVNRHTLRQAVQQLVRAGYVRVEHGSGTFVQGRAIDYPLRPRTRFSEIVLARGLNPEREILSVERASASHKQANHLAVKQGAPLIRIETRAAASGEIIVVGNHWFPASRLQEIADAVSRTKSITKALASLGHQDYLRAWTTVTAELPDEAIAALLNRPANRPILRTESLNISAAGEPLELGTSYFAGDMCRLRILGADSAA